MTVTSLIKKSRLGSRSCHPLWRVLFYGSDTFSLTSLKLLNDNRLGRTSQPCVIGTLEVVCTKLKGPIVDYTIREQIQVRQWPFQVPRNTFDIGVVVSFGRMISSTDIEACKYGMINVHPSLLPRWRGAAPLVHTLLAGDALSGISIITVAPKRFDTGKIVMQHEVPVPPVVDLPSYSAMMAKIGSNLLLTCLKDLPSLLSKASPQSADGITKAPKVTKEMGMIHWNGDSCEYLQRLYRAVSNFVDITTLWKGSPVKLYNMVSADELVNAKVDELVQVKELGPGYCYYHPKRRLLCIRCLDGWVAFREISIKSHRRMTATDFNCGFLQKTPAEERYFVS
ncbi:methionyl-tRNA formyltransferase, mitochondrial-like isoform X2 [Ornithodoros turicata]|uniref:methionyl-tRNA formyltransferase, mitochondrial-like isoform X2 n=1 Tax=Ornithodoros turicata TaxID=34597 RepID=UPI0031396483